MKKSFIAAVVAAALSTAPAYSQDELVFKPFPTTRSELAFRGCSLIEGVTRAIVTRKGGQVELPAKAGRKAARLGARYNFFACGDNGTGEDSIFAKVNADDTAVEFDLDEDDFPVKSTSGVPEAACKEFPGSIFKPCVCAEQIPSSIKFRPSLDACGGDAAAILQGTFANSFSVVLRDSQNRDRWPASGYNGCSADEVEEGLSKCSAFKCQSVIKSAGQQICCFGEPGTSPILGGATRMTVKIKDLPGATTDPLLRLCLPGFDPTASLN